MTGITSQLSRHEYVKNGEQHGGIPAHDSIDDLMDKISSRLADIL
jgi:hypothetical protein